MCGLYVAGSMYTDLSIDYFVTSIQWSSALLTGSEIEKDNLCECVNLQALNIFF
jgi:hypothetical protein